MWEWMRRSWNNFVEKSELIKFEVRSITCFFSILLQRWIFSHILNVKLHWNLTNQLKLLNQWKKENISTVTFPHVSLFFILLFSIIQSITSVIHFIIIVWHFLHLSNQAIEKSDVFIFPIFGMFDINDQNSSTSHFVFFHSIKPIKHQW